MADRGKRSAYYFWCSRCAVLNMQARSPPEGVVLSRGGRTRTPDAQFWRLPFWPLNYAPMSSYEKPPARASPRERLPASACAYPEASPLASPVPRCEDMARCQSRVAGISYDGQVFTKTTIRAGADSWQRINAPRRQPLLIPFPSLDFSTPMPPSLLIR